MTICIALFIVGVVILLAWNVMKMEELDELDEELRKYSVHLDEKANQLARWEDELKQWESTKTEQKKESNGQQAD